MGKRKNNEQVKSPQEGAKAPKFDKSPRKRNDVSSDSDSDHSEDETNHVEAEDTRHDEGPLNYEPDKFRMLVESFLEFVNANSYTATTVHNMEKAVTEWIKTQSEMIDSKFFTTDFRKYLKQATKFRNFSLGDATTTQINYLSSDKSLTEFSSYPDKPQTKFQLYIKKKNIEYKGVNGALMKSIHARMAKDEEGAREVEEELNEAKAQFIPRLQEFLDSHPNLTAEQKQHIKNKIKSLDKKVNPRTPSQKTARGKKANVPETAFSLFCRSKNDKYRDLSDEEREKKLSKKFAKLPAETRDLFEGLALNMS